MIVDDQNVMVYSHLFTNTLTIHNKTVIVTHSRRTCTYIVVIVFNYYIIITSYIINIIHLLNSRISHITRHISHTNINLYINNSRSFSSAQVHTMPTMLHNYPQDPILIKKYRTRKSNMPTSCVNLPPSTIARNSPFTSMPS